MALTNDKHHYIFKLLQNIAIARVLCLCFSNICRINGVYVSKLWSMLKYS